MSGPQATYPGWSEFKLLLTSKFSIGSSRKGTTVTQPSPEAVTAGQPTALATTPNNHDDKSHGECATIIIARQAPGAESKEAADATSSGCGTSSSGSSLWHKEIQEGKEEEGRHGGFCKKRNKKVQLMIPVDHISDTEGCDSDNMAPARARARARNDEYHDRGQDRYSRENHGRSCYCCDCRSGWTTGAAAAGIMWESGVVDADILCMRAMTDGVGVLYGR